MIHDILLNILVVFCIIYIIHDIGWCGGITKEFLKDKAVPPSPLEDVKVELELVDQILKGTAQLNLSIDRNTGEFTATLDFTDPITNTDYHYIATSPSVQQAINEVVMEYVRLIESETSAS